MISTCRALDAVRQVKGGRILRQAVSGLLPASVRRYTKSWNFDLGNSEGYVLWTV